jgi:hypothetical protein
MKTTEKLTVDQLKIAAIDELLVNMSSAEVLEFLFAVQDNYLKDEELRQGKIIDVENSIYFLWRFYNELKNIEKAEKALQTTSPIQP